MLTVRDLRSGYGNKEILHGIDLDLPKGAIVTILKKKGKNAKIFLTGKVRYIAEEPVNVNVNEEGNERAKVDYSRDI